MNALLSLQAAGYARHGRTLIQDASVEIEGGSFTVVIGPNGAGKSTLLRLMSGELVPTAGAACFEGARLETIAPWRLACGRAVMTQAVDVTSPFTAGEIVDLGMAGIGRSTSAAQRARIASQALATMEATEFAGRRYDRLSGGERRRVQFARALAQLEAGASLQTRQALLLDEPVANLDLRHQLRLLDEARRSARSGVAVLAVLHDLSLAARYADRLVLVADGAIVAQGLCAQVLRAPLLAEAFGVELSVGRSFNGATALVLPSAWAARGDAGMT